MPEVQPPSDEKITVKMPKELDEEESPKEEFATLTLPDGRVIKMNVFYPTMGAEVLVDIRSLHTKAKVLTYDPGFNSTASCESRITYIDGDKGLCLYRGYPVHELIRADISYVEVCHLLLYGNLCGRAAKSSFLKQIKNEMLVHEQLKVFVQTFIGGAHPMSILSSIISAMASFYADPMSGDHIDKWEDRELACVRLIAKMPCIAAMIYRTTTGLPIVYPRASLTYAENFLNMMFGTPVEEYRIDPIKAKIVEAFLIIHADHEQNASTSTVRTAGSSLANPYACIAAGITSLWGRNHGGANEAVIKMLKEIGHESNVASYVENVKLNKIRIMGFGHRIYRNYDPRAAVMRDLCYELFNSTKVRDPLFDIAKKLEIVALQDQYFISRKLYPNVDFYSGIVMRGLDIPENMFTVMFALGRCVGWLSHWKEMIQEKQIRISRPRQLYRGRQLRVVSKKSDQSSVESFEELLNVREEEAHTLADPGATFHEIQAQVLQVQNPKVSPCRTEFPTDKDTLESQPCADFSSV